jgi:cyclopropane fatty-acyl-phospholipid synthase-like methyltransferase
MNGVLMKSYSPAAERNQGPIFEVLNPYLKTQAQVLEIASGSGQHADYFCEKRPDIIWQACDPDPASLASLGSYHAEGKHAGLQKPIAWSVLDPLPQKLDRSFDAVVNINMIHISPWEACIALLDHCQTWLATGGILYLYGPYIMSDRPTAPSNLAFHQSLQDRDPRWGLRDLDRVKAEAEARGLRWLKTIDMPAQNVSVLFAR